MIWRRRGGETEPPPPRGSRRLRSAPVYVESHGHLAGGERPYNGFDEMTISVWLVPFIDTPLPA